jgi:hypothetical protein
MAIDTKRLGMDVRRMKAIRIDTPIGRMKTGATNVIRKNYSELLRMHNEDNCRWTEIAKALGDQGVTQGDGDPLTGRRLTALMHNIARQREKERTRIVSRSQRVDISPDHVGHKDERKSKLKLARELIEPTTPRQNTVLSEEDIRRTEFERHAHLIKRK